LKNEVKKAARQAREKDTKIKPVKKLDSTSGSQEDGKKKNRGNKKKRKVWHLIVGVGIKSREGRQPLNNPCQRRNFRGRGMEVQQDAVRTWPKS